MKAKKKYCACGCGKTVNLDKRHFRVDGRYYICNHQRRGIKLSKQACKHMSESHLRRKKRLGYVNSPETRKKMSETRLGKPCHTEEHKKEISDWSKELWKDPKHREKMKEVWKGRKHSKETRKKMKIAAKERMTPEVIEKIVSKLRGRKRSEEAKRKTSESLRQSWKDPEIRKRRLESMVNTFAALPTKPEKDLRKILKRLFPKEYKYVGDGKFWINGRNPDFINVNGQKKIIELFGDYWHSKQRTGLPKKIHRKKRQQHFAEYGYKTCVVWEHELENVSKLEEKLKVFHYSTNSI